MTLRYIPKRTFVDSNKEIFEMKSSTVSTSSTTAIKITMLEISGANFNQWIGGNKRKSEN